MPAGASQVSEGNFLEAHSLRISLTGRPQVCGDIQRYFTTGRARPLGLRAAVLKLLDSATTMVAEVALWYGSLPGG